MSQENNFTVNGSLIDDYDIFADYEPDSLSRVMQWMYDIISVLKLVIGVLALASDIYLIVIIRKFQSLKTRINNFILQYAIYNLIFLLLSNVFHVIIGISGVRGVSYSTYMLIESVDDLTIYLSFLILTFMACDWFVSNYYPDIYEQYKKLFNHGTYIIVLVSIFLWTIISLLCFVEHDSLYLARLVLEEVTYISCAIVITTVTILKQKHISSAYKNEYALTIPKTVFMLSFFYYIFKIYLEFSSGDMLTVHSSISFLFFYLGQALFLASPVIIVYQLIKLDKHFSSAYMKSCNKKRVHNYDDDNLDTDSLTDTPAGNVSFDKDSVSINV